MGYIINIWMPRNPECVLHLSVFLPVHGLLYFAPCVFPESATPARPSLCTALVNTIGNKGQQGLVVVIAVTTAVVQTTAGLWDDNTILGSHLMFMLTGFWHFAVNWPMTWLISDYKAMLQIWESVQQSEQFTGVINNLSQQRNTGRDMLQHSFLSLDCQINKNRYFLRTILTVPSRCCFGSQLCPLWL